MNISVSQIFLFILYLSFNTYLVGAEQLSLTVQAEGAILINAKTGAVLFEKNSDDPFFPASTTKIATVLYILHQPNLDLNQLVVAKKDALASITPQAKIQSNYRSPPHWLETDGTHIGIKNGEEMRIADLLRAILIASANDASNVMAQHIGGTIPDFTEGMNRFLKEKIGCTKTTYSNPHGLHHPDHVTTPADLARMAREAMKIPLFREIVSTVRYTCPETNLEHERNFIQSNHLLRAGSYNYPQATGIKTGFTKAAGKNLVASAECNGRELIGVLLSCKTKAELYQDMIKLFESAFREPKMRRILLKPGIQTITRPVKGAKGKLKTALNEGLYYDFYPSEEEPVRAVIEWAIRDELPIRKGEEVGRIFVLNTKDGSKISEVPIMAGEDLNPTIWTRIKQKYKARKWFFLSMGGAFFVFFFLWKKKKKAKRPLFPQ